MLLNAATKASINAMLPLVLVENERTTGGNYDHWQDATGERYQFPNGYRNKLLTGRRFIYYRGSLRKDGSRRTPEYFGHGVIAEVVEDPSNDPNKKKQSRKWLAAIGDYTPFPNPVEFKKSGVPYEEIPQNLWGMAVREISEETYAAIIAESGVILGELDTTGVRPNTSSKLKPVEGSLLVPHKRTPNQNFSFNTNSSNYRRSKFSTAIGTLGEEVVLKYLQQELPPSAAKTLWWNAKEGETPGWDIQYTNTDGNLVAVEVKATTGSRFPSVELTSNEWSAAARIRKWYQLALVASAGTDEPVIEFIEDPFGKCDHGSMHVEPSIWRLKLIADPDSGTLEEQHDEIE